MAFPRISVPAPISLRQVFASLQSPNYRLFFTGQGISLIGTWMQYVALSWLVYRLTGSVFLLGLIAFCNEIPNFILGPFTGVLSDRFNRHRLMIAAQFLFLLQALAMGLLVLTGLIAVWHIFLLSILFGMISAFEAPSRQALVVDLIDRPEDLGNAIALNSALFNGARLVGPAIAGVTIAIVGEGICFLINALSFFAVILALMRMQMPVRDKVSHHLNLRKSFSEGFQYTARHIPIRTLLTMLAAISLAGLPFMVLLPPYAKEVLHGGSEILGFLMSSLGAGALLGALYLAGRKTILGLGRLISMNSFLLSISVIAASFSTILWFSLICMFLAGVAMIMVVAAINTLLHTLVDEDKRGRVMSFYAMSLMGTVPIGNLIAGTIASGIGIPYTFLAAGLTTGLAAAWFESSRKSLRKYVHPIYLSKGIIKEQQLP